MVFVVHCNNCSWFKIHFSLLAKCFVFCYNNALCIICIVNVHLNHRSSLFWPLLCLLLLLYYEPAMFIVIWIIVNSYSYNVCICWFIAYNILHSLHGWSKYYSVDNLVTRSKQSLFTIFWGPSGILGQSLVKGWKAYACLWQSTDDFPLWCGLSCMVALAAEQHAWCSAMCEWYSVLGICAISIGFDAMAEKGPELWV